MTRFCTVLGFAAWFAAFPSSGIQFRTARLEPRGSAPSRATNIDAFFGDRRNAKPRTIYGGLEVRDLLTASFGDPLKPSKKGAVLTGLNFLSHGTLAPHAATKPTALSGVQHVLFVATGWGTVKAGSFSADLRQGIGLVIPPKVTFTLANGGDKPLTLYIVEEPLPRDFKPRNAITVKNDFDTPRSTNLRRVGADGWLFGPRDGLASLGGMDVITFVPRSYVAPHVHLPGDEEIWIALDDMNVRLGSEFRALPEGSAYKVPADGLTPHVNINASRSERRLLWLMRTTETPEDETPPSRRGRDARDLI